MAVVGALISGGRDFRLDINGLRAWAVMSVVLYHFGVLGADGGFAGVDVFFVISGYLMCGIIVGGQECGKFSVWRFYLARARRIFPALIVLCLIVLIFGWFFLMPEEYKQLGKHARESLTFSSNLRYFDESGYFDAASREKWLLHTWSLSVEWQFYLLLPLILMLQSKFFPGRRNTFALLGLLFTISLSLCLWRTSVNPSEAFYLIQNRAWEMLAGALVFMCGAQTWSGCVRRTIELLGLALILATVVLLDKHSIWPGWYAILPVSGAALVLLSARNRSLWTANTVAQWLGTRSYSIYLWHWPLVVALSYSERLQEPLWLILAILGSLFLGHLSYVLVEVRSQEKLSRMTAIRAGIFLFIALAISATLAQQVRRSGFPDRLPEPISSIESARLNHNPRIKECLDPAASCVYGEEPVRAVIIGDSHADAVVTALQAALPGGKGGVLFLGGSGCPIVFGIQGSSEKSYCVELNKRLENTYSDFPAAVPVVVMGRTSEYVNGGKPADVKSYFNFGGGSGKIDSIYLAGFRVNYIKTMCLLSESRPVYIVRPTPEMSVDVPTSIGRAMLLGQSKSISLSLFEYHKRHAFTWSMQDEAAQKCGVKLLDPLPYLCADDVCRTVDNGLPIYRDTDHLTELGNKLLVPMFKQVFTAP